MTVKELIEELSQVDGSLEVRVSSEAFEGTTDIVEVYINSKNCIIDVDG